MGKIDYSCPLPEEKLIERFKPVFSKLEKHQSATLLALPYTGRTSNLRFILSNKKVLNKLDFSMKDKIISLIDIDKTNGTYESFMSEIIESLTQTNISTDIFKDSYLLNKELFKIICNLTTKKEVVLILTLNQKSISFSSDIDRLITQSQKTTNKFPLTILWSIDTEVYRKYIKSHPSSTFGQNLFIFPTFNKTETDYSIKRILLSKSIEKFENFKNSFEKTAGIAGLFHTFTNINDIDLYKQELVQKIFKYLNEEIKNNKVSIDKLITDQAKELITKKNDNSINYKSIKLIGSPTAQEINLLNSLLKIEAPLSRDGIAQILWGKNWNSKYSDWAIDKAISRLRKKIIGNEIKILTIKNYGYQLFK
jgi:hypothetical protein